MSGHRIDWGKDLDITKQKPVHSSLKEGQENLINETGTGPFMKGWSFLAGMHFPYPALQWLQNGSLLNQGSPGKDQSGRIGVRSLEGPKSLWEDGPRASRLTPTSGTPPIPLMGAVCPTTVGHVCSFSLWSWCFSVSSFRIYNDLLVSRTLRSPFSLLGRGGCYRMVVTALAVSDLWLLLLSGTLQDHCCFLSPASACFQILAPVL